MHQPSWWALACSVQSPRRPPVCTIGQTTKGATSRVGFVHAATMDVTVLLYSGSLLARVTGHHTPGKLLGLAGLGVMTVGGFLGGHLTYSMGVNVEQEGPTLRAVK